MNDIEIPAAMWVPQEKIVTVLSEWGEDNWPLEDFTKMVLEAVEAIPEKYRATTTVELGGYETPFLKIDYVRTETGEEVNERIGQYVRYKLEREQRERLQYETLKERFESS